MLSTTNKHSNSISLRTTIMTTNYIFRSYPTNSFVCACVRVCCVHALKTVSISTQYLPNVRTADSSGKVRNVPGGKYLPISAKKRDNKENPRLK